MDPKWMEWNACLGIESWGRCPYNPGAPQVYFSLGDMAAVLALLLAVYQWLSPTLKLRFQVAPIRRRLVVGLFVGTFTCVLIAAAIPAVIGTPPRVIGYPIFWELLGAICLVLSACCAAAILTKPARFTERNAILLLAEVRGLLTRGDAASLQAVAENLAASVPAMIEAARSVYVDVQLRKAIADEDFRRFAVEGLDLLAHRPFCRMLVEAYPAMTIQFLSELQRHKDVHPGAALHRELVHQAFANPQSLLYREDEYAGLGRKKSFELTVFSDYSAVVALRPLQALRTYEDVPITPLTVKRYAACLVTAFRACVADEISRQRPAHALAGGMEELAGFPWSALIAQGRITDQHEMRASAGYKMLREAAKGLVKIIDVLRTAARDLPDAPPVPQRRLEFGNERSLYGVVALGIFELFETASWIRGHDSAIRSALIDVWMEIDPVAPDARLDPLRDRLRVLLAERVTQNLQDRAYPPMVRSLLSLIGLNPAADASGFFQQEFYGQLRRHLPSLMADDTEYANGLVPEDTCVEASEGRLRLVRRVSGPRGYEEALQLTGLD